MTIYRGIKELQLLFKRIYIFKKQKMYLKLFFTFCRFLEKPSQLKETSITPILKPEQFPSLSYYLARLLDPIRLEPHVALSNLYGKCYMCENQSCSCLEPHSSG